MPLYLKMPAKNQDSLPFFKKYCAETNASTEIICHDPIKKRRFIQEQTRAFPVIFIKK